MKYFSKILIKLRNRTAFRLFRELFFDLNNKLDRNFYLAANPDVRQENIDAIFHFIRKGWKENRRVTINDDANDFLIANADIAKKLFMLEKLSNTKNIDALFLKSISDFYPDQNDNFELINNKPADILFIGYVEAGLGLGEVLRNTIRCYSSVALNFSIQPFNRSVESRFIGRFMPEFYDFKNRHKINIFEMSIDQLDEAFHSLGTERVNFSYNILKIYWELSQIPQAKIDALRRFDEIWAPSKFVQQAVEGVFNGPVTYIPPHVDVSHRDSLSRHHFDLKQNVFYFLYSFDFNSALARKNPEAILYAFKEAFPSNDTSVGLVFKVNRPEHQDDRLRFMEFVNQFDDMRITVIDKFIDRDAMLSLIACCNCYVSLHRSEGFGMGMAEALALGRPVIATDYSANQDYLTDNNGYPVRFTLVPIENNAYFLGSGQSWADPVHQDAVDKMRQVYMDSQTSGAKTSNSNIFGRARIARIMKNRIESILEHRV